MEKYIIIFSLIVGLILLLILVISIVKNNSKKAKEEYNKLIKEGEKLKRELKKLPHSFGASIGYSVINSEVKSIEDAINEASIMMRKDKKNEKENWKFYK